MTLVGLVAPGWWMMKMSGRKNTQARPEIKKMHVTLPLLRLKVGLPPCTWAIASFSLPILGFPAFAADSLPVSVDTPSPPLTLLFRLHFCNHNHGTHTFIHPPTLSHTVIHSSPCAHYSTLKYRVCHTFIRQGPFISNKFIGSQTDPNR